MDNLDLLEHREKKLHDNMMNMVDIVARTIIPKFNPASIYHYTSADGLKSILQSYNDENKGKLWFSHYNYLNDYSELQYICSVVKECLEDLRNENPVLYHIYKGKQGEVDFENRLSKHLSSLDVYVASFSMEVDKLNMWLHYTKDQNSSGYCIEFQSFEFLSNMVKLNDGALLRGSPVIYDKNDQKTLISSVLQTYDGQIYKPDELTDEERASFFQPIFELFSFLAPFIKHEAFAGECEYRIICISPHPDCIMTRTKNGHFVPYIELYYDREKIKSITCSPTLYQCPVEIGLKALLSAYELPSCEIKRSGIPFRSN